MRAILTSAVAAGITFGASAVIHAQRGPGSAATPHAGGAPAVRTVATASADTSGTVPVRPPSVPQRPPSVPQRPASVPVRPPSVPPHAATLPAVAGKYPVHHARGGHGNVVYVPYFFGAPLFVGPDATGYPSDAFGVAPTPEYDAGPAAPPSPSEGGVYLDVHPTNAQVYVDGYYLGTVADFNSAAGTLSAGVHQFELRAPDYESVAVPMSIAAGRTITYQAVLRRTAGAPPPAAPVVERLYVISGCYAGNVPPTASSVPPGCDPAQAHVLEMPH